MTELSTSQDTKVPYRSLKFGDIYFQGEALRQKLEGTDDVSLELAILVPKPGDDDEVVYVKRIVATI